MKKRLTLLLCCLLAFACQPEKDTLSICEITCDDEIITDQLKDVAAKVIENNTYTNEVGDTLALAGIVKDNFDRQ